MKQILIIGLFVCFWSWSCMGQNMGKRMEKSSEVESKFDDATSRLDCTLKLDRARALFEKGLLEQIPPLLSSCGRNNSLSASTRKDILKLLAETHLFLDQKNEASIYYAAILNMEPFYKPRVNIDHPELVHLSKDFRTYPYLSVGLRGGASRTSVKVGDTFLYQDTITTKEEEYGDNWHSVEGVFLSFRPGGKRVELTIEVLLAAASYDYVGRLTTKKMGQSGFLVFNEDQKLVRFPLSVKYLLGKSKLRPYVQIGGVLEIVRQARIDDVKLSIDQNGAFVGQEQSTGESLLKLNGVALRNRVNYAAMGGIGCQYHVNQYYFFVDLRYNRMFNNVVNVDNRLNNGQISQKFWHIDNDLKFDNFVFSVGAAFSLFRTERLR